MGVINCSPNSFHAPVQNYDEALSQAEAMIQAGAAILDVGGEATNPFVNIECEAPSVQAEIDRVALVIDAIKERFDVLVSVDTSRPEVMLAANADMINDQRALQLPGALEAAIKLDVPVCLMHFFDKRVPGSTSLQVMLMQIKNDLMAFVKRCELAGIARNKLIIDPGFGQGNYGKSCDENFYLLSHLDQLVALGLPVLSGWSRKSMIGDVLGVTADKRLYGSITAAVISAQKGASILRVHDVAATMDAIKVLRKQCEMELFE